MACLRLFYGFFNPTRALHRRVRLGAEEADGRDAYWQVAPKRSQPFSCRFKNGGLVSAGGRGGLRGARERYSIAAIALRAVRVRVLISVHSRCGPHTRAVTYM